MKPITIEHMDLKQIADSGQSFRWKESGDNRYTIEAFGKSLTAEQRGQQFSFSCGEAEFQEVWSNYFDLGRDYGAVKERIDPADEYLCSAAAYGSGIRVLRQDLWEVMVCFLISQNNNISRIKNSIGGLCQVYGKNQSFPRPDDLAGGSAQDFERLGLGYRGKYLAALAEQMSGGGFEELSWTLLAADDEGARAELMTLYGVGRKVADCICLFGLHRDDMFPADTHINQIIAAHYGGDFPYKRYAGSLGVIQQYLFYYHLKK